MSAAVVVTNPVSMVNLMSFVNNDFVCLKPDFSLHCTSCDWNERDKMVKVTVSYADCHVHGDD
jgi:hypothetical protein